MRKGYVLTSLFGFCFFRFDKLFQYLPFFLGQPQQHSLVTTDFVLNGRTS